MSDIRIFSPICSILVIRMTLSISLNGLLTFGQLCMLSSQGLIISFVFLHRDVYGGNTKNPLQIFLKTCHHPLIIVTCFAGEILSMGSWGLVA